MNYDEVYEQIVDWFLDMDNFISISDLYHWIRTVTDESFEKRARALLGADEARKSK